MLSMEEDVLADRPTQIAGKYREVTDCPIAIDFGKYPTCGVIGERQDCVKLGKNLIIQATAHQSYDDLRVVVLCDADETDEWAFCRWLPHVFDESRSQRFIADNPAQQKSLLNRLEETLAQRWAELSEGNDENRRTVATPFYLFVCAPFP